MVENIELSISVIESMTINKDLKKRMLDVIDKEKHLEKYITKLWVLTIVDIGFEKNPK